MINAGRYSHRIQIYQTIIVKDAQGFQSEQQVVILEPYAKVRTTRGFTLIQNGSDFEKAYTNFTIRFPKTRVTRDMMVRFHGKNYTIEYLNNVNEAGIELEMQCKEVTK